MKVIYEVFGHIHWYSSIRSLSSHASKPMVPHSSAVQFLRMCLEEFWLLVLVGMWIEIFLVLLRERTCYNIPRNSKLQARMKYSSLHLSYKYLWIMSIHFRRMQGFWWRACSFPWKRIKGHSKKIQFISLIIICTGKDRATTSQCMISKEV